MLANGGTMGLQIQTLNSKLVSNGFLPDYASVTPENIAMLQWANGRLLSDLDLSLVGNFEPINSAADVGMNFVTAPEQPACGCDAGFDYTQALALFNKTEVAMSEMSLLNPVNVKYLLDATDGSVSFEDL